MSFKNCMWMRIAIFGKHTSMYYFNIKINIKIFLFMTSIMEMIVKEIIRNKEKIQSLL